jgi:Fe-S-cluster-containing dehydrogenase component
MVVYKKLKGRHKNYYKRKHLSYMRVEFGGRYYRCPICMKRLHVGERKYCSDKCRKTRLKLKDRMDYYINKDKKGTSEYKQRQKVKNRDKRWNKLSEEEKDYIINNYVKQYMKHISVGGENG